MAEFQILDEGFDPTSSITDIERAQLLQMVRNAELVNLAGLVLRSDTALNVALYPKLAYFIWHETAAGVPTGRLHFYNGTDWVPLKFAVGSLSGDVLIDGSVDISKLDVGTGAALTILRVKNDLSGFELASIDTIITAGSLGVGKFTALGTGMIDRIFVTTTGGVWTTAEFGAYFSAILLAQQLVPHTTLFDGDTSGTEGMVLVKRDPPATGYRHDYIENLLRNNSTPTNKLLYASGMALKFLRVNGAGTDINGVTLAELTTTISPKSAIRKSVNPSGTVAQAYTVASVRDGVVFNTDIDPTSLCTVVNTEQITVPIGTYLIKITVPIHCNSSAVQGVLILRNVTGAVDVDAVPFVVTNDAQMLLVELNHIATFSVATTLEVQVLANDNGLYFGPFSAVTFASVTVTYSTFVLTKLS